MNLALTFLGTGTSQGIPVIGSDHPVCKSRDPRDQRLRSSVLLTWPKGKLIIDCGPDFRQQLLRNPIERLDAVLITHEHADHTMGIDDIRPFFFKQGDIHFYATSRVFAALAKRFDYIFDQSFNYPGIPEISEHIIHKNQPFQVNDLSILPVEVDHAGMPVTGFRFGDLAYVTDIKTIGKEQMSLLMNCKVLIINALREEPHHSHLSLSEAIELSRALNAENTYFTHISHTLGFHEEVQQRLPQNMFLAYDQLTITL
ncbi:MAG: MBL fold metallo-hydrolase [Flavobacteriaceae bacterium]|jgi:phosphoribosyl 1,2-cyclic phosphate phosphodiesterase